MKNITIKSFILFALMVISISRINAGTAHSTTIGGIWDDESTWVEGFIPGTNDTAIIHGPVYVGYTINYNTYNSDGGWVIVEEGGSLGPHVYGGGLGTFYLFVEHDIINYGTLSNAANSQDQFEHLVISVKGNVINHASWEPFKTELTGTDQTLFLYDGADFGGFWENSSSNTITAGTDLVFDCRYYDSNWGTGEFNLSGTTLEMGSFAINTTGTLIYNGTLSGDFKIEGRFAVDKNPADTLQMIGKVTITDTIECSTYGGGLGILNLLIDGDIINNGVVRDNMDLRNDDELSILITGNITNNGKWTCQHVKFIGTADQTIQQATGKEFDSYFYDHFDNSKILANSDISITKNIELLGSTIDMQNNKLSLGGMMYGGVLGNAILDGGTIHNMTFTGSLTIEGKVISDEGNVITCGLIVQDSLISQEYGGGSHYYEMTCQEDVTNNGYIGDYSSGDGLRLFLSGENITDNGEWKNAFNVLNRDGDQFLTQGNGCIFTGEFSANKPSGQIIASSDLVFSKGFNLNGTQFDMKGNILGIGGNLKNGEIIDAGLNGGVLENITCLGDLTILGTVTIDEGNTINGDVLVTDTLQSNQYGGGSKYFDLSINGSVTNMGCIKNINGGDMLRLYITGNITNGGTWENTMTHVYVTENQYIELIDNKQITGTVEFDANIAAGTYQWYFEGTILDSPDFEGETSQVLKWNVPVSDQWYGSFTCETGSRETVGLIVKQGFLGIQDVDETSVKVWSYGNQLIIDLQETTSGEARVFDMMGREVASKGLKGGMNKIQLAQPGYYVAVVRAGQKSLSRKFYIQ